MGAAKRMRVMPIDELLDRVAREQQGGEEFPQLCGVGGCIRELHSAGDKTKHRENVHDIIVEIPQKEREVMDGKQGQAPSVGPADPPAPEADAGTPPAGTEEPVVDVDAGRAPEPEPVKSAEVAPEPAAAPASNEYQPCGIEGCTTKITAKGRSMHMVRKHPGVPLPPLSGTPVTPRARRAAPSEPAPVPPRNPAPVPSSPAPPRAAPASTNGQAVFKVWLRAFGPRDDAATEKLGKLAHEISAVVPGSEVWQRLGGRELELLVVEEVRP